jgi:CRISPR system Cascade subunit CasE
MIIGLSQTKLQTCRIDQPEVYKRMEQAVCDWFKRKGETAGYSTDGKMPEVNSYRQNLLRKRGHNEIMFSSIDLTGVLAVTDPECFLNTLTKGIGHARSFGCGLMLIKPL